MITEKKKILFLVTKNDVGGAQKYVADLAANIDKTRFEAKIVTGGKDGVRFLSNAYFPYLLFINDWLAIAELFLLFKKEKPDIVHLNSSKAGIVGSIAAKLAGVRRVIFTAHGWVFNPDNELTWLRRQFYITLHQIAALFQNKIINVSEYDRKLALSHRIAPEEKLAVIHNGIDHQNLKFLDKKTARKALVALVSSAECRVSGNETWIGSIGRLVTEKNYKDFVRAAAEIKNENVKFFILGDGEQYDAIQTLITDCNLRNRFFIIRDIAPAAPYLKAFDIFTLSSIKEGFPYTILEAMAAGLPIVATRVGGITEALETNGLMMPPREPGELARAINHFLKNSDEAAKHAYALKKTSKEKFTIDRMIRETEQIYFS